MMNPFRRALSNLLGVGDTSASARPSHTSTAFEPLEDRRLLAAAALVSQTLQDTRWLLVVQYSDADAINTSTLDNNDIRVTGPNSYNQLGTFQYFVPTGPGGNNTQLRAVYAVPAPQNAWSYADNGPYTIAQLANAVRDTGSEFVPAGNLQTFNLAFSTPRAQATGAYTTATQFIVNVRYSDETGIDGATIGFQEVGLRRQTDPNNVTFVRSQAFFQNTDGSWTATYRLPATGGSWDFSDTGNYDLVINGNQIRDLNSPSHFLPAQTLSTYGLFFTEPKATYVTTSVPSNDWTITIRYTDNTAIDTTTIGVGDISVTNGIVTSQGAPVSTTVESASSVLVTYTVRQDHYGWGSSENGNYVLSVAENAVRDTSGAPLHALTLRTFGLFFEAPSVSRPTTNPITSTTFNFNVTYTDNTGINFASVGDGDFHVEGPGGYFAQASLISKTTRVDSQGRTVVDASYRFTPVGGVFASGAYRIFMNASQVADNNGNFAPAFQWAHYDLA